ncbi:hypothetical protein K488DRAFT_73535 [Vararia minispora EC-137]|uniref:Uncharacterized protein n=1 Tax=Vararia minispora EC-137 TaxID=1314806 RepID=A0ACB8QAJ7_9AGAM|nr:hypothetical protein K488DRAFT_73535 [Vararia minispora EC-137]
MHAGGAPAIVVVRPESICGLGVALHPDLADDELEAQMQDGMLAVPAVDERGRVDAYVPMEKEERARDEEARDADRLFARPRRRDSPPIAHGTSSVPPPRSPSAVSLDDAEPWTVVSRRVRTEERDNARRRCSELLEMEMEMRYTLVRRRTDALPRRTTDALSRRAPSLASGEVREHSLCSRSPPARSPSLRTPPTPSLTARSPPLPTPPPSLSAHTPPLTSRSPPVPPIPPTPERRPSFLRRVLRQSQDAEESESAARMRTRTAGTEPARPRTRTAGAEPARTQTAGAEPARTQTAGAEPARTRTRTQTAGAGASRRKAERRAISEGQDDGRARTRSQSAWRGFLARVGREREKEGAGAGARELRGRIGAPRPLSPVAQWGWVEQGALVGVV